MGVECPSCHHHGAFVLAITATGEPAKKESDIIARKLSCGHVIGSDQYMTFRSKLQAIEAQEANAIMKIKEASKRQRLDIWAKINASITEA